VVALEKKGDGAHAKLSRYALDGRRITGVEGEVKTPDAVEELARRVLFEVEEPIALPQPRAPTVATPIVARPSTEAGAPKKQAAVTAVAAPAPEPGPTRSGGYFEFGLGFGAAGFQREAGSIPWARRSPTRCPSASPCKSAPARP
jgi:hypothetical protein